MATRVNSIDMPHEYIEVCNDCHSGQDCLLYAVASSGGLYLGSTRPDGCDTDEKWYLRLWISLSADITAVVRMFARNGDVPEELKEFADFVDKTIDKLREEYDLQDWDD